MNRAARICALGCLLLLASDVPVWSQMQRRRGGGGKQPGPSSDKVEPLATFTGVLKGIGSKTLTLELPESNTVEFNCSKKTKYYDGSKTIPASAVQPGSRVTVEAQRARDGTLDAVNVRLERQPGGS